MKLLLDTHSLMWWFKDDPNLSQRTRSIIADKRTAVLVSSYSFWEMSIKYRLGKLDDIGSDMMSEARSSGFVIVDLSESHLRWLEAFEPQPGHKDPFDHIILAQAVVEDAILVTSDRRLLAYDVRTLPA
ncbi:MAG: type II toxin-antitoxin system VapC family toxin [Novosphingobium sp.]